MGYREPIIEHFSYYPLIAVRNSYITIQWAVKSAFFVYINNGIGFRKAKGIKLTIHNKSNTYRITAFGWFVKETKVLEPLTLKVDTQIPQAKLIGKMLVYTANSDVNSFKIKSLKGFSQINKLKIRYKPLSIKPDIEPLKTDLLKIQQCESTKELEMLKTLENNFRNGLNENTIKE